MIITHQATVHLQYISGIQAKTLTGIRPKLTGITLLSFHLKQSSQQHFGLAYRLAPASHLVSRNMSSIIIPSNSCILNKKKTLPKMLNYFKWAGWLLLKDTLTGHTVVSTILPWQAFLWFHHQLFESHRQIFLLWSHFCQYGFKKKLPQQVQLWTTQARWLSSYLSSLF